jgi:2-methylcitrate dehydratase PrpD
VKLEVHPDFDMLVTGMIEEGKVPVMFNSTVEIKAARKQYSIDMPTPKGSKDRPATKEELTEKFRTNACFSPLKTSRTERIVEMILGLEELSDVNELTETMIIS